MQKPLFLLAALACATASFAQAPAATSPAPTTHLPTHRVTRPADLRTRAPHTPAQRADHRTALLTKKLGLTAAQQPQVHAIALAQAQAAQALKAQYPEASQRPALHQALQADRAKYQAQLRQVLTAEQASQLAALQQAHHHHGPHGPQPKARG